MIEIKSETSGFGAEIVGVNLAANLPTGVFEEIRTAIIRHKVLAFRDQNLDDTGHYAFALRFGPLEGHINRSTRLDAMPKLQVFGNVNSEGKITVIFLLFFKLISINKSSLIIEFSVPSTFLWSTVIQDT